MYSKPVILVVISFLTVGLVCGSASAVNDDVRIIEQTDPTCYKVPGSESYDGRYKRTCCWVEYYEDTGLTYANTCQDCAMKPNGEELNCDAEVTDVVDPPPK